MGVSVIFVMLCATAVTWPIQIYILDKLGLGYLQTLVFILVIAALVQFVEITLRKFLPSLPQRSWGLSSTDNDKLHRAWCRYQQHYRRL